MTMGKLQLTLNHPRDALAAFDRAEKSSPYRNGAESLAPEVYAELAEGRSEGIGCSHSGMKRSRSSRRQSRGRPGFRGAGQASSTLRGEWTDEDG